MILHRSSGERKKEGGGGEQEAFPEIKSTHATGVLGFSLPEATPPSVFYAPPKARQTQNFDPYPCGILLKRP